MKDEFEQAIRLMHERMSRRVEEALAGTPLPPAPPSPYYPGQLRSKGGLTLIQGGKS